MMTEAEETQLIEIIFKWDEFERRQNRIEIIDFNLLSEFKTRSKYKNRRDILSDLEFILPKITDERIQSKTLSHITYLRALIKDAIPFHAYIENTQQIPVKYFSEAYIRQIQIELNLTLDELHIDFNEKTLDSLNALDSEIPDQDCEKYFSQIYEKNKPYVESHLNREFDFDMIIETVNEDAYWSCWVDSKDDAFRLRINLKAKPYTQTKVLQMVYHELLAHCCQMAFWREQIREGKLSRIWGLTTVHGPEQFLFEGLAQTLPLFFKNEFTDNILLQAKIKLSHYDALIWNNLHIMINEAKTANECIKYAKNYLPWTKENNIRNDLISRLENILFRSYQYVYPCSFDFFMKLANKCGELKPEFYSDILLYSDLKPLLDS